MNFKKFFVVMLALLVCVGLVGCKGCKKDGDKETYKITYDYDGGNEVAGAVTSYEAGSAVQLIKPTKENYKFEGWYVNGDSKPTFYLDADRSGDLTLKAAWAEIYHNIKYTTNGGTLAQGAPTQFTQSAGLATLPSITKEGVAFGGWTINGVKVTSIPAGTDGDVALVANWGAGQEGHHLINYNTNEGVLENPVVSFDEAVGLAELPVPTREGYVFKGWYTDPEFSDVSKLTSIVAGTTEDVTLYAKWDEAGAVIYYTITYICEDGTLPVDAPTQFQGGVGCELPIPTPNNAEESFLGWYNEAYQKIDKITGNVYNNVTLTAVFGQKGIYEPRWDLNAIGFNGQGMTYEIKVLPVTEYDPFNPDYSGSQKSIKQTHQNKVEAAYNISIKYTNWEDAAPWGPERVKFINKKYLNDDFGDVYVVNIASEWIPTLVGGNSIAELYDMNADDGIFLGLSYDEEEQFEEGYLQDSTFNQAASVKGKVYGYENGVARPDYFMYYNVNLVKECQLEDPAELWLKGEWTLDKFDAWIRTAQTVLSTKGGYALDMGFAESTIGFTASTGHQMTKVSPPILYLAQTSVTDNIALLQEYYHAGLYYGRGVQDVSPGFAGGTTLLHHGDLWFLKNSERFNPTKMTFTIGVVPYPTASGEGGIPVTTTDVEEAIKIGENEYLTNAAGEYIKTVDMSESSFQVPYTGSGCYAVLNVENGKNGINAEIIMHVLHDLISGLGPDPDQLVNLTAEESYRNFLETKFDRDIDIEVIMSCQGKTYFEIMSVLSMTVGGGSHFGDGAWWPLAASIIKGSDSPVTAINEVLAKYKQAMRDLGYNIK